MDARIYIYSFATAKLAPIQSCAGENVSDWLHGGITFSESTPVVAAAIPIAGVGRCACVCEPVCVSVSVCVGTCEAAGGWSSRRAQNGRLLSLEFIKVSLSGP